MTDELLRFRAEFPILERTTYMISNSLGAMPRGVYDALKGYADIMGHARCARMGRKMVDDGAEVGDAIGALMNAPRVGRPTRTSPVARR